MKIEYIILIVKSSFNSVDTLLVSPDNNALDLAAKEATLVYHTVKENQTLASTTCSSRLIRTIFGADSKFSCAETKANAILCGTTFFLFDYELVFFFYI